MVSNKLGLSLLAQSSLEVSTFHQSPNLKGFVSPYIFFFFESFPLSWTRCSSDHSSPVLLTFQEAIAMPGLCFPGHVCFLRKVLISLCHRWEDGLRDLEGEKNQNKKLWTLFGGCDSSSWSLSGLLVLSLRFVGRTVKQFVFCLSTGLRPHSLGFCEVDRKCTCSLRTASSPRGGSVRKTPFCLQPLILCPPLTNKDKVRSQKYA